jgi:hypothetical protein
MQQSIFCSETKIVVIANGQPINFRNEFDEEASLRVGISVDMLAVLLWILCLTKTLQAPQPRPPVRYILFQFCDDVKDTFFCHDKRFRLNKTAIRHLERTNYVLFK